MTGKSQHTFEVGDRVRHENDRDAIAPHGVVVAIAPADDRSILPTYRVQWHSGRVGHHWGGDLRPAPCEHGCYYDCGHGCESAAVADREVSS